MEAIGGLVNFFVGEASPAWFHGRFRIKRRLHQLALFKRGGVLYQLVLCFSAPPSNGGREEALEASASRVLVPHSSPSLSTPLQHSRSKREGRMNRGGEIKWAMKEVEGEGEALMAFKTVHLEKLSEMLCFLRDTKEAFIAIVVFGICSGEQMSNKRVERRG
ncbi:hypothetical protein Cni_G17332 [Canna indica]|uniref:Uncharacterized protein n=1 Tax=Canna indica TaxID=4628 RepID=A0AAQ3QF04_9LILI|nr:hypothetical protein Cni_G17332 [Canna indica]